MLLYYSVLFQVKLGGGIYEGLIFGFLRVGCFPYIVGGELNNETD